ncbi:hypothetical protein BDA99DRAFT_506927 [Phascolomyces articulosus]|uniref:MYND-type zinc finger protein samB n=1 Tax=Phascolomyces articulosus TaxID=60185 RepID=A0AAD5K3A0_9FUNG|nr:hypothetical protein BDA99DRAFT_506927 [Phascolomyces articulosus]
MTAPTTIASLEKYLASYHLALVQDKDKGKSVVATAPLERGAIVTTSQPLGTVPLKANRHEFCNYCFRKLGSTATTYNQTTPLQRCSRCKSAYFCDMACFKNAWLSYHQFVCQPATPNNHHHHDDDESNNKINDDEEEDDSTLDLEMTERVALNVSRFMKRQQVNGEQQQGMEPNDEETVQVTMEAFASLMDHLDNHPHYLLDHYASVAKTAKEKSYLVDTPLQEKQLIQFLGRFKCNNFAIYDEQLFTMGEGTYPVASLFNHSCRPNAAVLFDGALLVIKAIDNIQPDEEITIAYVDIAHSRTARQKTLRDKYFFQCTCERCRDDNVIGRIDGMLGEEESDWDRAERLLNGHHGDPTKQDDISKHIMQLVEEEWDLPVMTKTYNRTNGTIPDRSKPLSLQYYVHFLLPFLTPYLWSASNPAIQFVGTRSPTHHSNSANSSATGTILKQLTAFDDPPRHAALPDSAASDSYHDILGAAIDQVSTYPPAEIIPFRITTLSACTKLFVDTMMEGNWRAATKLGMYVLVQYSIIYPPYHPMLAQHLLLLAKSAWNSIIQNEIQGGKLETFQERGVRRWILLAKEAILYTFGKQSTMWREVLELEWIFIREQNLKK